VPRSSRARRRHGTLTDQSLEDLRRFAAVGGALAALVLVLLLAVPGLTGAAPSANVETSATGRPSLGSGPVKLVVYSDFQCPACAAAAPELSRLAGEGLVTVEYRYFPLVSIHANATAAAQAAQAAALQGDFWPFHDALFARQAAWADLPAAGAFRAFEAIASDLGLDVARWQIDSASRETARLVDADRLEAERMRLPGTPTVFIDGVRHDGPFTYGALLDAVRAAED
jgi:protein-disulfide isomerase